MRENMKPYIQAILRNLFAIMLVFSTGAAQARTVRIGVYDNPPKVLTKNGQTPRGIFIDIIARVAEEEKWDLDYIRGTWNECLEHLEKGEIDLMPDVAFSKQRSAIFDFNKIPVLSSWLQIYCRPDNLISSVSQLDGKKISILHGSIQQEVSEALQEQLDINFEMILLPDYESTVKIVERGKADAVIVSRFYGYSQKKSDILVPTPVILNPSTLHFITMKGTNTDLLNRIDHHIATMMNNPNSDYYESMTRWLLHKKPQFLIPRFLIYFLFAITGLTILFVVFSLLLKRQVNNRTKALKINNEKLKAAIEELERVHKEAVNRERLHALGQLTSGIAHDFNNLLTPVLICVDMMIEDQDKPENAEEIRQNLLTIKKAASHGAELVRSMQNFCRSATRNQREEKVNINEIIDEALQLAGIRWLSPSKSRNTSVNITRDFGTDVEISGKRTELHEMILNLALNAVDAMPGGGKIEIKTRKIESAVFITIKDSGTGMPDEIMKKCLQPFFTTKGEKGTGMGLAMVNNIVREHKGELNITSSPGAGTTFTITFPACE